MNTNDACKGCGHSFHDHYRGPDPDHPGLDSMYCAEDGCLCWERFAIARPNPGPLTLDRKPPCKWRVTHVAPDCPESVKHLLQERCDELNAEDTPYHS